MGCVASTRIMGKESLTQRLIACLHYRCNLCFTTILSDAACMYKYHTIMFSKKDLHMNIHIFYSSLIHIYIYIW